MAKVTKRDKFLDIFAILSDAGEAELADFIAGEIELVDKRASKPRALTPAQKENVILKGQIPVILETAGKGLTATEVATELDISVQRTSQLLRQLVEAGTVTRVEGKGKTKTVFTV